MIFNFRRGIESWEVIDSRGVEATPVYYSDDEDEIISVARVETRGTYVFNMANLQKGSELRSALLFSRQQLLRDVQHKGWNALLMEHWHLTVLRRGKHQHRVQVEYSAKPARATISSTESSKNPPFLDILSVPL